MPVRYKHHNIESNVVFRYNEAAGGSGNTTIRHDFHVFFFCPKNVRLGGILNIIEMSIIHKLSSQQMHLPQIKFFKLYFGYIYGLFFSIT